MGPIYVRLSQENWNALYYVLLGGALIRTDNSAQRARDACSRIKGIIEHHKGTLGPVLAFEEQDWQLVSTLVRGVCLLRGGKWPNWADYVCTEIRAAIEKERRRLESLKYRDPFLDDSENPVITDLMDASGMSEADAWEVITPDND